MKVTFDINHEQITDSYYSESQLVICMTGRNSYFIEKLKKIIAEIEENGKAAQGCIYSSGRMCEVMTPIWDGHKYSDAISMIEFDTKKAKDDML